MCGSHQFNLFNLCLFVKNNIFYNIEIKVGLVDICPLEVFMNNLDSYTTYFLLNFRMFIYLIRMKNL